MTLNQHQQLTAVRDHDAVEPPTSQSHQRATLLSRITSHELDATIHHWRKRHGITLLRIGMGTVIFEFGVVKYFPGASPAENLVRATIHLLTFGLIPDSVMIVLTATVECAIGLSLITGRGLRVTSCLLMGWIIDVLSPLVLLPGRLFSGPGHAPTLEGQNVFNDFILLTASLVIVTTLRHAKENGGERAHKAERNIIEIIGALPYKTRAASIVLILSSVLISATAGVANDSAWRPHGSTAVSVGWSGGTVRGAGPLLPGQGRLRRRCAMARQ